MRKIAINSKGMSRVRAGHPWVFRSDLLSGSVDDGEAVHVVDQSGKPAGTAFYSAGSQIALRFFDRRHVEASPDYFRAKFQKAVALRERLYPGAAAVRLCFGESDGIPALVVDRYGPVVVIQTLAPGPEMLKDDIVSWCMDLTDVGAVVERNDPKVRSLERLPLITGTLRGDVPPELAITEGGCRLGVDVLCGQKTGAFLDQRDNRDLAASRARGRVLDAFCYRGWFSLRAAVRAERVTAVDAADEAVAAVKEGALVLGLHNVDAVCANAFDYLRECDLRGERFDMTILDPPAFAKNKAALGAARRGYKEINLRAIRLAEPGGTVFTFSCSYHMSEDDFLETVASAASDAGRRVSVERRLSQSLDHPILLGFPESAYLKGLMLRVE
ncbi:MAG: class I SAM-dependent rRNA methyltransferase [Deltaproteobacteria bacterium]|nr:class I SAM-dependent rRNA methyltransferase [Deltaproteobacteria bacterium]